MQLNSLELVLAKRNKAIPNNKVELAWELRIKTKLDLMCIMLYLIFSTLSKTSGLASDNTLFLHIFLSLTYHFGGK